MTDIEITTRSPQEAKYVAKSCRQLLRPLVRLALWFGLKYQEFDEVVREVFIEEAIAAWQKEHGKAPSASQVSVTTGINRKEIKRLGAEDSDSQIPARSLSSIAFTKWINGALNRTIKQRLAVQTTDKETSFESMIGEIGSDVHFRSVLSELTRLGLARETDGYVELCALDFTPTTDTEKLAGLLAENTGAHLSAAVSNMIHKGLPYLEQAVWATDFGRDDCIAVQNVARSTWHEVRGKLLAAMEEVNPATPPPNPHRVRVGMYVHFEPMA